MLLKAVFIFDYSDDTITDEECLKFEINGQLEGLAFISKKYIDPSGQEIRLKKCPVCNQKAPSPISAMKCSFCDFDLNEQKIGKISKMINLISCPICHNEYVSLTTNIGKCAWCGFDVNEHEIEIARLIQ